MVIAKIFLLLLKKLCSTPPLGAVSPPLRVQDLMLEAIGLFWFFLSSFKIKFIFMYVILGT